MKQALRIFLITITMLVASAYANAQSAPPPAEPPKLTVKTIAVVPAVSPADYIMDNPSVGKAITGFLFPIFASIDSVDQSRKLEQFNQKLLEKPLTLGKDFTEAVAAELRTLGYVVNILDNVERSARRPDRIDYEKLVFTEDAAVHVSLWEVGVRSPRTAPAFLPVVNAGVVVYAKSRKEYLFDENIHYGADAKKDADWAIASDPKYTFTEHADLINNIDDVRAALQEGAREISKRMAKDIHEAIK